MTAIELATFANFIIGAEAGNAIAVKVALSRAGLQNVRMYLSDAADGLAVSADPPSGGSAITVGTLLKAHTAALDLDVLTDKNGAFTVTLTEAAADTWYLCLVLPDGRVLVSPAITFA